MSFDDGLLRVEWALNNVNTTRCLQISTINIGDRVHVWLGLVAAASGYDGGLRVIELKIITCHMS